MAEQILTNGDVIEVKGQELEVVHVSYRERNGQKEYITYSFRSKAEMDAEREEQRQIEEDQRKAREESQAEPITNEEAGRTA